MRAAIIGVGIIGKVHTQILLEQGVEIAAICDIDRSQMDKLCQDLAIDCPRYEDYKEMLLEIKADVVHICTPHYLHADMVIFALQKNINTLCEKPLCIKSCEIEKILDAEKNSKAILGVVHQNRYNQASLFVKEILKDKKIISAHCSMVWSRDKGYYDLGKWRGKKDTEGGGVAINQALHTLDLIADFCGMPSSVTAQTGKLKLKDVIEVEDTVTAAFNGDTNFIFFATNASIYNFPIEFTIQTESENIHIFDNKVIIDGKIQKFKNDDNIRFKKYYGNSHCKLINDFYNCIKNQIKFRIDGKEGAKVIKLILAIYKSQGEKIKI